MKIQFQNSYCGRHVANQVLMFHFRHYVYWQTNPTSQFDSNHFKVNRKFAGKNKGLIVDYIGIKSKWTWLSPFAQKKDSDILKTSNNPL
jgi:hypothetical protein